MNINLNKITNGFKKIPPTIESKRKLVLFLIFILLMGYASYQWYRYVYKFGWSEEKKQAYINSQAKMATFDEDKFNQVIQEISNRNLNGQKKIENIPNIFKLK